MSRYIKPIASCALAAIAVMLWWPYFLGDVPQAEFSPTIQNTGDTLPASPVSPEVNEFREVSEANGFATTTGERTEIADSTDREYPDRKQEPVHPEQPTAAERVQIALRQGDVKTAYQAYNAILRCNWMPETDEEWQQYIDQLERDRKNPDVPLQAIGVMERSLERALARREDCTALRSVATASFFEQLLERAENGDPVARFLYAMWPPTDSSSYYMESEALLTYYAIALELTHANLEEGHPLGLLALGLSHHHGRYFAPSGFMGEIAYFIAAELCSGGKFQLQDLVNAGLEFLEAGYAPQYPSAEQVMETGIRLHDDYCATSMANSAE